MKYSKLVKLAQDTQTPQMHKQAAPSGRNIAITAGSGALSGLAGYALARLAGASNKKALGIGAGAGAAGAGLGYAGSAYGAQMSPSGRDIAITAGSGALSGLAGYALARLAGASNKKALSIGAGAGAAGAVLPPAAVRLDERLADVQAGINALLAK